MQLSHDRPIFTATFSFFVVFFSFFLFGFVFLFYSYSFMYLFPRRLLPSRLAPLLAHIRPFWGSRVGEFLFDGFLLFFLFFSFSASARSYRVFTEFSMCSKGLLAVLIAVYSIRRRTYVSTRYSGQPSIKLIAGRSAA